MVYTERYLPEWSFLKSVLAPKMIFIAGPRQCGKTTMIRQFLSDQGCRKLYYNWDTPGVKKNYLNDPTFFESEGRLHKSSGRPVWIAHDEIHKRARWKDILKGYYDQFSDDFRFLISGSARLDLFRKTGDSLIGRYFLFNLFPFSCAELNGTEYSLLTFWQFLRTHKDWSDLLEVVASTPPPPDDQWEQYYTFGPFPEPLIKADLSFSNLWHQEYMSLYLREEIRDLTRIADIDGVERLAYILPHRVSSILSINSLREDLQVSYATVKSWLDSLTKLYLIFSLKPWQHKIHRSLKKEKKYYFMDWAYVPEDNIGARFENMVAVGLLRLCMALRENGLGNYELFFIRDLTKREVDFLVVRDNKPVLLVEAKIQDQRMSGYGINLARKLGNIPIIQLTHQTGILKKINDTAFVISANHFFSRLP